MTWAGSGANDWFMNTFIREHMNYRDTHYFISSF